MWASGEDLLKIYNSIPSHNVNTRISRTDISVSDLRVLLEPKQQINNKVIEITRKWHELDEKHLFKTEKVANSGGATFISIPQYFDLWKPNNDFDSLHHPDIPFEKKKEYLQSLSDLLRQVPKYSELLKENENNQLETIRLKRKFDAIRTIEANKYIKGCTSILERPLQRIMSHSSPIPNIQPHTNKSARQQEAVAISSNNSLEHIIITVSIHGPDPTSPAQQEIEVSGSATLVELAAHVYCIHTELQQRAESERKAQLDEHGIGPYSSSSAANVATNHTSGSLLAGGVGQERGHFFYIENKFYYSGPPRRGGSGHTADSGETTSTLIKIHKACRWLVGEETMSQEEACQCRSRVSCKFSDGKADATEKHNGSTISLAAVKKLSRLEQLGGEEQTLSSIVDLNQESIKLGALRVRLGVRYLFAHLDGNCEHSIYFTDIRVATKSEMARSSTPKTTGFATRKYRICQVCLANGGKYLVYGDKLAAHSPTLFCQFCYHMLHYSKEGQLLYDDFIVLPYLHDTI